MIKIINLKESIYPDVAVYNLGHEIEIAKKSDINVIIAIHGYGSHGYGGEIRKEIHKNLRLLKSGHQIVDFIKGEQIWNFADFQTTEGILRANGNKKGVFTRQRQPKDVAYLLKKRWENLPLDYKG